MDPCALPRERIERDTRHWLERAVIGLNLCPFAKAVHTKGQIYYAVSEAVTHQSLFDDLARELDDLMGREPCQRETTLLMAPMLCDFLEFNDFLGKAERLIAKRGWANEIQLASFHPDYQFAGSGSGDIANFTNRSPYPTLHLLRGASVARAVEAFAQPASIYEANVETMRRLGLAGWAQLRVGSS